MKYFSLSKISSILLSVLISACANTSAQIPLHLTPQESYTLGVRKAVDGNYEQSKQLLESAAERKFLPAQWDYAIFLKGMSPEEFQNPVEAYAWFSVVYQRDPINYKLAAKHIERLENRLTEAELSISKMLAEKYIRDYSK